MVLPNCYDAIGLMLMIRIIHQHQVGLVHNIFFLVGLVTFFISEERDFFYGSIISFITV